MSDTYCTKSTGSSFRVVPHSKPHQGFKGSRFPQTQGALVNDSKSKGNKSTIQCGFCGESHYADQCTRFRSADERRAQLKGKCYRCLGSNHQSSQCKRQLSCYYCKKNSHHSSLCNETFGKGQGSYHQKSGTPDQNKQAGAKDSSLFQEEQSVYMQMAIAYFPQNNAHARILFDTGSSRSYITSHLSQSLGLSYIGQEFISAAQFGGKKRKNLTYNFAEIQVPTSGNNQSVPVTVLVTDQITCPLQKYPLDTKVHPIITQIPLADPLSEQVEQVTIDVLIGVDHYCDFVGTERIPLGQGLFLLDSKLGYIVTGKTVNLGSNCASTVMLFHHSCDVERRIFDVEKFWSLEDIGVKDNPYQADDDRALQLFNDSIKLVDGRYEVTWPWKDVSPDLPSNYNLAVGRLRSLMNRIGNQEEVVQQYQKVIADQLDKGIIEEVKSQHEGALIHYLPHHCVIRNDKATTKLRVVYDASAKASRTSSSLNECLLRGPVILQDICGMLVRFRLSTIAMTSDVEKAFLQVGLQESERDVTRFLWPKDKSQPITDSNLRVFRFCLVPFGVISSPFLLSATIKHHCMQLNSKVSNDISANIYVDNVLAGRNSVDDAIAYYRESKTLFQSISMNIREWYTNSPEVKVIFSEADKGKDVDPKVLGLTWELDSDTLSCPGVKPHSVTKLTKRSLLQVLSASYDPCGFFSPLTIQGKFLVQDLWKNKVSWDSEVKEDFLDVFKGIQSGLERIKDVKIPRIVNQWVQNEEAAHELHCFCDASSKAYAAVAYLRSTVQNGGVRSNLLFSKVRLAPIKGVTLPRLELMAAVIGGRMSNFLLKELRMSINKVILWSDSKCVLHWLHSNKVLSVFVRNRISELKSNGFIGFRYVPTACNPADIPSRGTTLEDLKNSNLWWNGPSFLLLPESQWPESEFEKCALAQLEEKVANDQILLNPVIHHNGIDQIVIPNRYSNLIKLLRVTAWVIRFVSKCRQGQVQGLNAKHPYLTKWELVNAEVIWIKAIQLMSFPAWFSGRKDSQSKEKTLGTFLDSLGILRCSGRIPTYSCEDEHPKLLPKNHDFTNLVIQHCHKKLLHAGVRQTLAQVRLEYWIPQGKSQVQKVLRRCLVCRKTEGGSFKVPVSPPLPWFRAKPSCPFEYIGIDYLGPLFVRVSGGSVEDSSQTWYKVWICLYTCAVTRAIHLDVVEALSAEEVLMSLRRFCAFYGKPSVIVSDNATQFKAVNSLLHVVFRSEVVQDFSSSEGIDWKFIPEAAPWMGGFYERLVGSIKRCLKKGLDKRCLTLAQLQTIVAEVSAVINTRPLVHCDFEVGEEALTPGHFLARNGRMGLPAFKEESDPSFVGKEERGKYLLEQWRKGQDLLDQFWKSWKNEYLMTLRERPEPNLSSRNPGVIQAKLGVVVNIKENLPRSRWKIGKIFTVNQSQDGLVRSANIVMPSGKSITRPIKLLYPIEEGISPAATVGTCEEITRKKRGAAVKASRLIKEQLNAESNEFD